MSWAINETYSPLELGLASTVRALDADRIVVWPAAFRTFVDECVGVTDSDCNSSAEFLRMSCGPHSSQCLNEGALSIVNMP